MSDEPVAAITPKVLVVDDDEKCLKLAGDVLDFHGYTTVRATSGEAALEIARTTPLRLVLLDIQLPGISGVKTFARLRQMPVWGDGLPVIVMTASVMPADRSALMSNGFTAFLAKPLPIKELVALVRRTLPADPA